MATRTSRQDSQGDRESLSDDELRRISQLSQFELIQEIAKLTARTEITDEESLYCALRYWWSKEYNRPYKDPLLENYTLEELAMEYYDKSERSVAEAEKLKLNDDKINTRGMQEAMDWAEQEEAKELAAAAAEKSEGHTPSEEEKAWMQKQIDQNLEQMKAEYGDDFGEDIVGGGED